jgi:Dolichyl-phosphate-mannose-protein mannosyltransferase
MTVTSAPAVTQAPPSTAASRQRLLGYLIFSVCASAYLFPFMRLLLLGTDEGLFVSGAMRVAHGQVFARDFFDIVGPGSFYWLAMFFKFFGVTFLAERICLFITSLGTALALYFLTRRICARYQLLPCIILAGAYFGMVWPTISHHVDSNFFGLLSVVSMVLWNDHRKNSLLLAAGVLAGATSCFHQPKGFLLLCAFVVWLWVQHRKRSSPLSSLALVIGGFIAPIGLMVIYFWSHHALRDLINANYIWPSKHYGPVNIVTYAQGIFGQYWTVWASSHTIFSILLASVLIIPFLFIAIIPALLPILGTLTAKSSFKPEISLYWLSGGAMWLAEIHRKDIQHLTFGSPLLIILCVYYLGQYHTKIAGLALQFLTVTAGCLAFFNLFLALTAHPFATRAGSVWLFRNDPAVTYLDEHVPRGQEIFVYPYSPMYYFLSDTTNPTIWSGLGYNYNSPADFQGVVQILDQHQVQFVVWDTVMEDRAIKFSPSIKRPRPEERIIEPYFSSRYKAVWEQDGIRIMERMSDAPTH